MKISCSMHPPENFILNHHKWTGIFDGQKPIIHHRYLFAVSAIIFDDFVTRNEPWRLKYLVLSPLVGLLFQLSVRQKIVYWIKLHRTVIPNVPIRFERSLNTSTQYLGFSNARSTLAGKKRLARYFWFLLACQVNQFSNHNKWLNFIGF